MRKLLIPLLLASAAVASPALAGPNDNNPRHGGDQNGQTESRPDRHPSSDQVRSERTNEEHSRSNDGPRVRPFGGGGQPDVSPVRVERDSSDGARNWRGGAVQQASGHPSVEQDRQDTGGRRVGWQDRVIENRSGEATNGGGRHLRVIENHAGDEGAQQPSGRGGRDFWQRRTRVVSSGGHDGGPTMGSGGLVQPERPLPRVLRSRTPVVSDIPREGTQPPLRTDVRRTTRHAWSGNWRHNHRYDWWNWRRNHRSHFHLGLYYDPFGWGYQPYSIGWRLWPSYYSSRYWLNDPWDYRLPYAPPGYRWIRYYDDAVLVDTFTGEVVDVIYNFFW